MMQSQSSRKMKKLLTEGEGQGAEKDEDDEMAGLRELAIDVDLQPIELTKEEEQNHAEAKME